MAVAFVSSATQLEAAAVTSTAVTVPAGATGDILVAAIVNSGTGAITDPGGWTRVHSIVATVNGCTLAVCYRVTDGSEASTYTWTIGVADQWSSAILRYSGVNGVHKDATQALAIGNPQSKPTASITPTINDCLILGFLGMDGTNAEGATSFTPDGGATERVDSQEATNRTINCVIELAQSTAAAISLSATYSVNGTAADVATGIIALDPISWTPETNSPKTLRVVSGIGRW